MTKYLSGIVTGVLAMLLGAWLMVSPFALGSQQGRVWNGQTQVEFWTGLAVLIVAVLAQLSYGAGLAADLRERGVVQPRPMRTVEVPAVAVPITPAPEPRLEDMLAPLIAALQSDLSANAQHSGGTQQTAAAAQPQTSPVQTTPLQAGPQQTHRRNQ